MEVILSDAERVDIENLALYANCEFDVNKTFTFSVQIARCYYDKSMFGFGSWVYVPGTECGGRIENINTSTALDYVELKGMTPRGKLNKKIIEPSAGQAYRIVSGELNDVLAILLNNTFDGYIVASDVDTGVSVSNYKFDRYCTLLEGINEMLKSKGYKLKIEAVREDMQPFYFVASAEPIEDYSSIIELSSDNKITFTMESNRMGINHLIGLGKGELTERAIVHRYIGEDGTVTNRQYYFGYDEIAQTYDLSSAEPDELTKKTEQKLLELASKDSMGMDVALLNIDVDIGDIVGGLDYLTGLRNAKPIENIIYSVTNGVESKKYKLEGESN